jgi:hypothetical protein
MKTLSQTAVINPSVFFLGLMVIALVTITLTDRKVPLLTNIRANMIVLLILGMAMCMQGGLARVAASNTWMHPLTFIGYVLGAAILIVTVAGYFNLKILFIQNEQQAFMWMAIFIFLKVINSLVHNLITRS